MAMKNSFCLVAAAALGLMLGGCNTKKAELPTKELEASKEGIKKDDSSKKELPPPPNQ
jgi:hypothetical protein